MKNLKFRWLTLSLLLMAGQIAAAEPVEPFVGGLFDLYAENRRDNIPNFITEDLLLLSYTLIERAATREMEEQEIIPGLGIFIDNLAKGLATQEGDDPTTLANRDLATLLQALWSGNDQTLADRARQEVDLILGAKGVAPSPLWEYPIDYSQFKPRGRYDETPELQRFFRCYRYASGVLFSVTPTLATGVTPEGAERMARQAAQLIESLEADPQAKAQRDKMVTLLQARFGAGEDISDDLLRQVLATKPQALAPALLKQARQAGQQPRILGGLVDIDRLEPGVTLADALTGWRLLPSLYTPESAIFQQLVFPGTGAWQGAGCKACPAPFGLGQVGDRQVKAYPLSLELMALLGNREASKRLKQGGEERFESYSKANKEAKALLRQARDLQRARLDFMTSALGEVTPASGGSDRLEAMQAFWTAIRYNEQLYVKQSYTPVGKGFALPKPRAGAWLEPSTALYTHLARLADQQGKWSTSPRWKGFSQLLHELAKISQRLASGGGPTEADEQRLNGLDERLLALADDKDKPIVVDIHTHAEEGQVVEEGIGFARIVKRQQARGARLDHQEFKHPLAQRLDDATWAELLSKGPPQGGGPPQ